MATWTVFGARNQRKVRIATRNQVTVDDDIFWSLWGDGGPETSEALEGGKIQLEILIGEQPRTFALRPCTTGMPIAFRQVVQSGAKRWSGNISAAVDELGLDAWRGRPLDTIWSTEDDKLIVTVPISTRERHTAESDEEGAEA